MMSIELAKKKAKILKKYIEQSEQTISHSACLNAVAMMEGYKNWNTMSAYLGDKQLLLSQNIAPEFWGKPVIISDIGLNILINGGSDGLFGLDAYHLLTVILSEVETNSLVVNNISRGRLWAREKWSNNKFNNALKQLLDVKFVHSTIDRDENLIITINPLLFWKGDAEKHEYAIKLFNLAVICSSEIIYNIESSLKLENDGINKIDISSIISYSEKREKAFAKKSIPRLVVLDKSDEATNALLGDLDSYLKAQKPVPDSLIHYLKVREIFDGEYTVLYSDGVITVTGYNKTFAFVTTNTVGLPDNYATPMMGNT